jgi:hypothetical protein
MTKIENIDVNAPTNTRKWPWIMEVGQSFLAEGVKPTSLSPQARKCQPARDWGWAYRCIIVRDDNGNFLGTRVGRVESNDFRQTGNAPTSVIPRTVEEAKAILSRRRAVAQGEWETRTN